MSDTPLTNETPQADPVEAPAETPAPAPPAAPQLRKIREWKVEQHGGFGGSGTFARVRYLTGAEPIPADAETVALETPEHDWQREAR